MSFTDSNASQLAYAVDPAKKAADVVATVLKPINITSDTLKPGIESKTSEDIRDDSQYSTARTVGGSVAGGVNANWRFEDYDDILLAAMRQTAWLTDSTDGTGKTTYIVNGRAKVPFLFERRLRVINDAGIEINDYRRFYSNFLSSMTIGMNNKDWVTLTSNFIGLGFENSEAVATGDETAGKLPGITYDTISASDPFDTSNSVTSLIVKNGAGVDMNMVMEQGSIELNNNTREDAGVANKYAVNVGFGRFKASLSGTFYFRNQDMLDAMLTDANLSIEVTFSNATGSYTLVIPRLRVSQDDEEPGQVDTTMRASITAQGFPEDVVIDGITYNCTAYIVKVAV